MLLNLIVFAIIIQRDNIASRMLPVWPTSVPNQVELCLSNCEIMTSYGERNKTSNMRFHDRVSLESPYCAGSRCYKVSECSTAIYLLLPPFLFVGHILIC